MRFRLQRGKHFKAVAVEERVVRHTQGQPS
jgi:hypothetical protein